MIRIVTDSSADIPDELLDRHRIEVVPLTIRFGSDEFVDRRDLDSHRFWEKLVAGPALPETAAPSAGAFLDTYRRMAAEGAEGVVAVCISSDMSATYQSAVIAAEQVAGDVAVRVVDSRAVSMMLGLQVLAAAEGAETGATLDEVASRAVTAGSNTGLFATLDTLEFLRRGGRIGGAQALIGGLLDVKPLITIADGVVQAAGRVRTRSRALAALTAEVARRAPRIRALAVLHGATTDLDRFEALVREAAPGVDPIVAELGAVVGTHAGPGVAGVAYRLS
ncbi:MAG: DegV family protein [Acidimicrobiia bacterium]|jgi:DegV family protein with EDD domain